MSAPAEPLRGGPAARRGRIGALLLAAALLAYLGLHLAAVGRVPPGIAADPAIEALRGVRLVLYRKLEVLTFSIGPSAETLYLYLLGASVAALGPTRMAVALPSALAATAVLLLLALFLSRLDPRPPPAVPLLLAGGCIWLFHYGQVGLRAILAPVFVLLAALIFDSASRFPSRGRLLALGAVLGLSIYAYSACRLLPIVWAVLVAWKLLKGRDREERRGILRSAGTVVIAFAIVSIPNLLFLLKAPAAFLDRGYYVYRGGPLDYLANILATFLLPFGYPDRYRIWSGAGHIFDAAGVAFTASGLNPLDLLTGIAFLAGLVRTRRSMPPGLAFLFVLWLSGSVLLGVSGPSLTRLLLLLPSYLAFASLGVAWAFERLPRARALFVACLLAWAFLRGRDYVFTFGRSPATYRFYPALNAMSERARDLAAEGHRVMLVTPGPRDIPKYYAFHNIDNVYYVDARPGRPDSGELPIAGFGPDVLLIERTNDLSPLAAQRGLKPDLSPSPLFEEYALLRDPGRTPTVRSNLRRLWVPIDW